jgi:His/Glu/Gln/Arg/opine family amino acid ABC transporter permease subunit
MEFDAGVFWDALTSRTFLDGAFITLALTAASIALGAVFGTALAVAKESGAWALRMGANTYVWFFRATPTLLQLLFVWNALPQVVPALKDDWYTPFIAALVALSLNEAAYMAEIARAGLLSVDDGQRQAGRALGMKPWSVFRRVVLPQAVRVAIPPTGNEFIAVLKLTSLASVISLNELLTVTGQAVSTSFRFAELYAAAAVYYLVMVSVFMVLQSRLERRFTWTTRRSGRRWPGREQPRTAHADAR